MRKITIVITTAALALLACSSDVIYNTVTDEPFNKPDECMSHVEAAVTNGNTNALADNLAPNFVFYFNPTDVGTNINGYVIPATWTADDLTRACGNMASATESHGLSVSEIPRPLSQETPYLAKNIRPYLEIEITPRVFHTDEGYCDFAFGVNDRMWVLTEWWDRTYVVTPSRENASLGVLLARYYEHS